MRFGGVVPDEENEPSRTSKLIHARMFWERPECPETQQLMRDLQLTATNVQL